MFVCLIAKEAFRRIGVEIELPYLPTERSISAANDGLHDGELNRIAGMEKIYPNLIRVDESMMDFEFVGLTKNISMTLTAIWTIRAFWITACR